MLDKNYMKWGLYGGSLVIILIAILYLFIFNTANAGFLGFVFGLIPLLPGLQIQNMIGSTLPGFLLIFFSAIFYFLLGFLLGLIARKLYLRYNE